MDSLLIEPSQPPFPLYWLDLTADPELGFFTDPKQIYLCWRNIWQKYLFQVNKAIFTL